MYNWIRLAVVLIVFILAILVVFKMAAHADMQCIAATDTSAYRDEESLIRQFTPLLKGNRPLANEVSDDLLHNRKLIFVNIGDKVTVTDEYNVAIDGAQLGVSVVLVQGQKGWMNSKTINCRQEK